MTKPDLSPDDLVERWDITLVELVNRISLGLRPTQGCCHTVTLDPGEYTGGLNVDWEEVGVDPNSLTMNFIHTLEKLKGAIQFCPENFPDYFHPKVIDFDAGEEPDDKDIQKAAERVFDEQVPYIKGLRFSNTEVERFEKDNNIVFQKKSIEQEPEELDVLEKTAGECLPTFVVEAWEDACQNESRGRKKQLLAALRAAQGLSNNDISKEFDIAGANNVAGYISKGLALGAFLNLPDLAAYMPDHRSREK